MKSIYVYWHTYGCPLISFLYSFLQFPYCFASNIYLQLENINNALSKQGNPDINFTYAQVSLQIPPSSSKAMFLHNFPIIPQIPVICKACITSFLGSRCLCRFSPTVWETLSQLSTWWSVSFRWLRIHFGCLYWKVLLSHLLAIKLWKMPLLFTITAQCGLCTVNQFIM